MFLCRPFLPLVLSWGVTNDPVMLAPGHRAPHSAALPCYGSHVSMTLSVSPGVIECEDRPWGPWRDWSPGAGDILVVIAGYFTCVTSCGRPLHHATLDSRPVSQLVKAGAECTRV